MQYTRKWNQFLSNYLSFSSTALSLTLKLPFFPLFAHPVILTMVFLNFVSIWFNLWNTNNLCMIKEIKKKWRS